MQRGRRIDEKSLGMSVWSDDHMTHIRLQGFLLNEVNPLGPLGLLFLLLLCPLLANKQHILFATPEAPTSRLDDSLLLCPYILRRSLFVQSRDHPSDLAPSPPLPLNPTNTSYEPPVQPQHHTTHSARVCCLSSTAHWRW